MTKFKLHLKILENNKRFSFHVLRPRGFTLMFAVLIGALLLAIGIALANIALRELSLSGMTRESGIAFYAADSGADCALYYDIQKNLFATPDNPAKKPPTPTNCNSQDISRTATPTNFSVSGTDPVITSFRVDYGSACAYIKVTKRSNGASEVFSDGINDCQNANNMMRVERSLVVKY